MGRAASTRSATRATTRSPSTSTRRSASRTRSSTPGRRATAKADKLGDRRLGHRPRPHQHVGGDRRGAAPRSTRTSDWRASDHANNRNVHGRAPTRTARRRAGRLGRGDELPAVHQHVGHLLAARPRPRRQGRDSSSDRISLSPAGHGRIEGRRRRLLLHLRAGQHDARDRRGRRQGLQRRRRRLQHEGRRGDLPHRPRAVGRHRRQRSRSPGRVAYIGQDSDTLVQLGATAIVTGRDVRLYAGDLMTQVTWVGGDHDRQGRRRRHLGRDQRPRPHDARPSSATRTPLDEHAARPRTARRTSTSPATSTSREARRRPVGVHGRRRRLAARRPDPDAAARQRRPKALHGARRRRVAAAADRHRHRGRGVSINIVHDTVQASIADAGRSRPATSP